MKKKIIIAAILITAIVLTILNFFSKESFRYSGVVEATEINIYARISDTVKNIMVQEGDSVKENDLLVRFDCKEINLKEELAKKEYIRASQLLQTKAGSKENYDIHQNNWQQASILKSYCTISSPITGTVLYRYYEPSEFIPAGKKILTLANLQELKVWVYVAHDELAKLKLGQSIKGYLPETKTWYKGKIISINDEAEFTPKNVQTRNERSRLVFGVKTLFENDANLTLKPGMTLEIDFNNNEN